jgi:mRNA interferase HigB
MTMHVLSKSRLAEFWAVHPASKGPLTKWHTAVEHAFWTCFDDVRKTYNSADQVGEFTVFDVNSYRVVATVRYRFRKVYISQDLTHSAYERWSKENR